MKQRKNNRLFLCLFLAAIIGAGLVLFFQYGDQKTPEKPTPKTFPRRTQHALKIRGFQFDGHHEGRKVLSIRADAFTIEKKKVGFLRFGMMNMALLKNATIDLYGKRGGLEKKQMPQKNREESDQTTARPPQSAGLSFADMFEKNALPSFPQKRIHGIEIAPVCVNLHHNDSLVTRICAGSSTIRLRDRSIVFKEEVRVSSGSKVLTTRELSLYPESAVIKTIHPYQLKVGTTIRKGTNMTWDITLNSIAQSLPTG